MEPKSKNLLVVDDDEVLRDTIVFDLKRRAFNVFVAENGRVAMEIVKSQRIDLVVSDIRMPGGDGISLLEQIRAYDPKIPTVIFITGFSDISEAECLQKGASRVMSKPFDRKELVKAVTDALTK